MLLLLLHRLGRPQRFDLTQRRRRLISNVEGKRRREDLIVMNKSLIDLCQVERESRPKQSRKMSSSSLSTTRTGEVAGSLET